MYEHLRSYQHFTIPSYLINKCLDPTVKMTRCVANLPKEQGCYLLICDDYVLYVGQSKNLRRRWSHHNLEDIIEGLVYKSGMLEKLFRLEYYLTEGGNRKTIEDFLNLYYWPVLCGNSGDRISIVSAINSHLLYGTYGNIPYRCHDYYQKRIKDYRWQNRCADFYKYYHRIFGNFESCKEQILLLSKIKNCLDISPFFPSIENPNDGITYAKFE